MISARVTCIAAIVAAAAFVAGCGGSAIRPGTLSGALVTPPTGPRHPRVTLSIGDVRDARPPEEHEGASVGTRLFIFFLAGVHIRREGNYITDDYAATKDAPGELQSLAAQALAGSGAATKVTVGGNADFNLRLTIEHLYSTHFAANKETIIVSSSKDSTNAFVDVKSHNYAAYGNVALYAELYDRRGPTPRRVWSEHVTGYAQRPAEKDRVAEAQQALRLATGDALETLGQRVCAALDRLTVGPSGAPMVLAPGSPVPGSFAIERVSRFRDFIERVFVDTATGRVVRHDVLPAPDRYASRPGDWLLSRVTAEGVLLSAEGYEKFAHILAGRYDLRRVDDAAHYHFFGVLGTAQAPSAAIP